MDNLELTFRENRITGSGTDIIGAFTFDGELYGGGRVQIRKQYLERHHVEYHGLFDGEGTLSGTWNIVNMAGNWMIKVVGGRDLGAIREMESIPDWNESNFA
jgi:hypothetical protein